ncbi:DUF6907 domain-containing protein [Streptomyces sp. NPDC006477]|uniref:DUF6907 domain-containing protein n=1 Tax=Streptomyces sp. NPDC006477 TaxID=3364747 RepID=UPI0036C2425D
MATQQLTGTPLGAAYPATRLVPAVVSGAEVQIECPSWCTVDHTGKTGMWLEDLSHESDFIDLEATVVGKPDGLQLFARLGQDLVSSKAYRRQPFLVLDGGDDADDLTLDAADEFADNLVAFAAQIRELTRAARGVSQ